MKSEYLDKSRAQLIKHITETRKNLVSNLSEISKRTELPQTSVDKYNEIINEYGGISKSSLYRKKTSNKDLKKIARRLDYISNLKSSSLSGAESTKQNWEPIEKHLKYLSPEKRKEFFDIYSIVRNELIGVIGDRYKYQMFNTISRLQGEGVDPAQIANRLINAYNIAEKRSRTLEGRGSEFLRIITSL